MRFYSLDYSLTFSSDRLAFVKNLLDQFDERNLVPTKTELEQFASFILYGKDDKLLSSYDRKDVYAEHKRFGSYKTCDDKVVSLDGLTELVTFDEREVSPLMQNQPRQIYRKLAPTIARPSYDENGNEIDPGDGDIPGMRQLWDSIDHYEYLIKLHTKKDFPYDPNHPINIKQPLGEYQIYKLRHMVIDLRRNQYYLKDGYKPTIHFLKTIRPQPQTIDWSGNGRYLIEKANDFVEQPTSPLYRYNTEETPKQTTTNPKPECSDATGDALRASPRSDKYVSSQESREENGAAASQANTNPTTDSHLSDDPSLSWYEPYQHTFDYEDPTHILALIKNYSEIMMQLWDQPDCYGRALLFDLERYYDMTPFSDIRKKIFFYAIDRKTTDTIVELINNEFGILYNKLHIMKIINTELPTAIATTAKRHRLITEISQGLREGKTAEQLNAKPCRTCQRVLPRTSLFYCINKAKKDGFNIHCKECEKIKRTEKGGSTNDKRYKQPKK